jgi:hypothetical protein
VTVNIPAGVTKALVIVTAGEFTSTGSDSAFMSYTVTGASSIAATDAHAFQVRGNNTVRASATSVVSGLTSGSNVFTAKYHVDAGTGTWANRDITVIPLP